jgi:hypothetical protein
MKFLFLVLCFLVFGCRAFAGFVAGSRINQCNRTDYISQSVCQESEEELCYKVPNDSGECGIFKLEKKYAGPSVNEESCSGQIECQELLSGKVCSVNHDPFINEGYSLVYCIEISGKELVIDEFLKLQKDTSRLAAESHEIAKENKIFEIKQNIVSKGGQNLTAVELKVFMSLPVTDNELGL